MKSLQMNKDLDLKQIKHIFVDIYGTLGVGNFEFSNYEVSVFHRLKVKVGISLVSGCSKDMTLDIARKLGLTTFCHAARNGSSMLHPIQNGEGDFEVKNTNITKKKEACLYIQDNLGMSEVDCMCIGDGIDDVGMFEVCSFSAVMGNADSTTKKKGDIVLGDVKNGSLFKFLEDSFAI